MKRLLFCLPLAASCTVISPDISVNVSDAPYNSFESCAQLTLSAYQPSISGSRLSDSLALVAIYDKMRGAEWPENGTAYAKTAFWLSDKPLERWCGVTTDSFWHESEDWGYEQGCDGRVRALKLTVGVSSIPDCVGDLTGLESLVLSGPFKGQVPDNLSAITGLQRLEIGGSGCCLEQCLDSLRLGTSLLHLSLEGNIYGSIPEWFSSFDDDACIRFDLMHRLSGRIPDAVVSKGFMTDGHRITYAVDESDPRYRLYSLEGSCDLDYFILNASLVNCYALWTGDSIPQGVRFVEDEHDGHWEWESVDAAREYVCRRTGNRLI